MEVKKQIGGLGHHYGGQGCGYENISIQIIEGVEQGIRKHWLTVRSSSKTNCVATYRTGAMHIVLERRRRKMVDFPPTSNTFNKKPYVYHQWLSSIYLL